MARDLLTEPPIGPAAAGRTAVVDRYLAALSSRLPGPRGARNAVLEEILDGLHEAVDRHAARGLPPQSAARAAVAEFGTPAAVAKAFAGELATAQARRTIGAFILTGPLIGVWWLFLLVPGPWRPDTVVAAIPASPLIAAAALAAMAVLATTGNLARWLPEAAPARALAVATAVVLACIAGDLTVLATLATHALIAPGSLPLGLAATAAAASMVRFGCASRAVGRCLRTRRVVL